MICARTLRAAAALALALAAARAEGANLVVIALDALRADRLGCYGHSRPTSPAMDRLAARGILFQNAYAPSSWTLPSFASLMTSLDTPEHGVWDPAAHSLSSAAVTLASVLRARGYETAAFAPGPWFAPRYGLGNGFERYRAPGPGRKNDPYSLAQVLPEALRWLSRRRERPFFLFLYAFEPHAPYRAPRPFHHRFDEGGGELVDRLKPDIRFTLAYNGEWSPEWGAPPSAADLEKIERVRADPRARAHAASHYDERIAYADSMIARVLERLEKAGLDDDTMVVLTADHGEELGERGRFGHNKALWESVLRVPLIVRLPAGRLAGARVAATARLVDLAPTVLDALGLPPEPAFRGSSLLPLATGRERGERDAFASSDYGGRRHALFSVRRGKWKAIGAGDGTLPRLYDLAQDPGETRDAAAERPELARRLGIELERRAAGAASSSSAGGMTPRQREALKAAGYLD